MKWKQPKQQLKILNLFFFFNYLILPLSSPIEVLDPLDLYGT